MCTHTHTHTHTHKLPNLNILPVGTTLAKAIGEQFPIFRERVMSKCNSPVLREGIRVKENLRLCPQGRLDIQDTVWDERKL